MYPIVNQNDRVKVTEFLLAMPDGVGIYTRIAVPNGKTKCPIIFDRTPYAEALCGKPYDIERLNGNLFIKHGYAIVTQHCRGSGDSEGEMHPYQNEKDDGLATLAYIRTLPFYNEEIYVTGKSYLASTHLLYLSEKPKDIKGACIEIQTDRMYYTTYRNGCYRDLPSMFSWYAERLKRRFPNQNPVSCERPYVDISKRTFGIDMPYFTQKLMHDTCDELWTNDSRWRVIDELEMPILLVEGWYDFYIDGMANMWERLPEETKSRSAMIIGPYGHATSVSRAAEYPFPNGNLSDSYMVDWFDSIRESRAYKHAEYGKITYYSIVGDRWRSNLYPSSEKNAKRLYFSKNNLLSEHPSENESISYKYDPDKSENPHKFYNVYKAFAPNSVEGIISYLSEPAKTEESFFGKIKFKVNVSTDCEDTAFFLRLYFTENGESYNLTETIFALSRFIPDYKSGDIASVEVETPPIAFTLKEGMRLRADISSVGGVYTPHANVKGHFACVTETRVAKNTFYTEDSCLEIPYEKQ